MQKNQHETQEKRNSNRLTGLLYCLTDQHLYIPRVKVNYFVILSLLTSESNVLVVTTDLSRRPLCLPVRLHLLSQIEAFSHHLDFVIES